MEQSLLVTGATGFLGTYLVPAADALRWRTVFAGFSGAAAPGIALRRCDLTNPTEIRGLLREVTPTVILHAAAMTNVDQCEEEPARADQMNCGSTRLLAEYAEERGSRLVYVSTDSVFDGTRGRYAESDEPNPVNEYARSKLRGEHAAALAPNHLVVRTNLFGRSALGVGLVEWILRELGSGRSIVGFADVVFSPLHCADLARHLLTLVAGEQRGVIHLGSSDAISKLEFAEHVAKVYGLDQSLIRAGSLRDVELTARRPANTSLDTALAATVLPTVLPTVRESIEQMAKAPAPRRLN